jgi:hypothetical protein
MYSGSLGYANKFVELPRLKAKHKACIARGNYDVTLPSLTAIVFYKEKKYRVGYRLSMNGQFFIIHVNGTVYPKGLENGFSTCKAGLVQSLYKPEWNTDEENE